jgi:hypothetical protein
VFLLGTFFFATAAVGRWREKHDVETIRAHFREREAEIRSAIAKVGDGVPLESFKALFPNAYYDKQDREWVVSIPTGYDENPACTNTFEENEYFSVDGEVVKPVEFKSGGGGIHADRFGPGGVWYYFWRAWYSSTDYYIEPPATQKQQEGEQASGGNGG